MKRKPPSLTTRCGGVTRRPSPSGHEERSSGTQKDDEAVKSTPVFRKAFSFAGGRRNGNLDHHEKPNATVSQKEQRREARRARLQIVSRQRVGDMGVLGRVLKEGSSRNARALHSALSARIGSSRLASPAVVGRSVFRKRHRVFKAESVWLTVQWLTPLRRMTTGRTQKKRSPARGSTFLMRVRMTAPKSVPVRRIWSAEVGRRQRSTETLSQRLRGKRANGDLAHG